MNMLAIKHVTKTPSQQFIRFAVRVNSRHLGKLNKITRQKDGSPDAILTDIVDKYFDIYASEVEGDLDGTTDVVEARGLPLKTNIAHWHGHYLNALQLQIFEALTLASAEQVVVASAFDIAQLAQLKDPRKVGSCVKSLIKKQMIGRLFIKRVGCADGRKIIDQYVYVLYADFKDVVML